MPKSRFFTIVCISLLLVFVYACNKGSNEDEAGEKSPQVEQAEAGEEAVNFQIKITHNFQIKIHAFSDSYNGIR